MAKDAGIDTCHWNGLPYRRDQRKCIVTSSFGDRKSEDVAVEMEEKLWLICDWNIRTEPPPSYQLYH